MKAKETAFQNKANDQMIVMTHKPNYKTPLLAPWHDMYRKQGGLCFYNNIVVQSY